MHAGYTPSAVLPRWHVAVCLCSVTAECRWQIAKMAQFNKLIPTSIHNYSIIFKLSVDFAVKRVNNTKLKMSHFIVVVTILHITLVTVADNSFTTTHKLQVSVQRRHGRVSLRSFIILQGCSSCAVTCNRLQIVLTFTKQ